MTKPPPSVRTRHLILTCLLPTIPLLFLGLGCVQRQPAAAHPETSPPPAPVERAAALPAPVEAPEPTPEAEAEPGVFELTIIHVNDLHSHFDPAPMPELGDFPDTLFGGYPAVLSYARQVREETPHTLFLHAGDEFQGTGYFVMSHGRANADLLNRMQIDAMVVGNHEFDELREMVISYSEDGETVESIVPGARIPRGKPLADFLDLVDFPVLGANMCVANDPYLAGRENLHPWVVLEVGGERIGVFGIVLEDMPSISAPGPDVVFPPEIEGARLAVEALLDQGVNKIIGISHIGYMRDKRIVRSVDGIDVMVGGHSHDLLGDFSALGLPVTGENPTVVTTPDGSQALVVQAGAYAKAVGRLDLTFDGDGNLLAWSGNNQLLAIADTLPEEDLPGEAAHLITRVSEDPALRAHIDQTYRPELDRIYGPPMAYVPSPLRHERLPSDPEGHGSQVAPLAAEALCWYLSERGLAVDGSIINAGSVRTPINAGPFHRNQPLLEVMIFANNVALFTLTGEQIRTVLESVIMPGMLDSDLDGRFPYTGRIAYVFDPARPEGERFISLQVQGEDGTWADVDDRATYTLAASSYVAGGSDGYDLLRQYIEENGGADMLEDVVDNQVFTAYVKHRAQQQDGELRALPTPTVTIRGIPGREPSAY